MSDRLIPLLKLACAVLAVLLILRTARVTTRTAPLGDLTIPDAPAWSPPAGTHSPPSGGTPSGAPRMMPGMPGGAAGAPPPSPTIQKRLDRIVESGLLGPVIRPPPMALLGIAGPDVLLRAPDGRTGLIREGGELGGVKLLRIGTNRVLVLENGQPKELTIFGGLGGDSLLPATEPPQP